MVASKTLALFTDQGPILHRRFNKLSKTWTSELILVPELLQAKLHACSTCLQDWEEI